RLCRNFARKYREILPENAELRICSGETWDVELTQIDGDHYFTAGWSKFAGDLELRPTDFLVFTFGGGSTFDVSVYGNDCCEKKPLLDLTAGWPEFRKINRLSVGKTYLFEFIPSKQVIQVKPIK
ncbi:hypothetical protein MIMGU_mgv1a026278mg, partial [Erythranthe guttata]